MQKILFVARIRKFVNESFGDEDIHNGNYFDVIENIKVPSEDGEFSEFDGVAVVTKTQKNFLENLFEDTNVKMAYVCL